MSDTSTPNTVPTAQGDTDPFISYIVGATPEDTFTIPFQFWTNEDLTVNFDGVTLVGWSTTGAGNPTGGSLILSDPVSDGTLTIQRYVPETRITIFPIAGPFRIEQLNTEFDHLLAVIADRRFVGESDQVVWDDIVGKPDVVTWDDLYPVGSLHITINNAPPPRGVWELVSDGAFLVSAGGGYTAGSTGGSRTQTFTSDPHTLTEAQMPVHDHPDTFTIVTFSDTAFFGARRLDSSGEIVTGGDRTTVSGTTGSSVSRLARDSGDNAWRKVNINLDHTHTLSGSVSNAGSSEAFTVTGTTDASDPPYIAAYMWRRTG